MMMIAIFRLAAARAMQRLPPLRRQCDNLPERGTKRPLQSITICAGAARRHKWQEKDSRLTTAVRSIPAFAFAQPEQRRMPIKTLPLTLKYWPFHFS